MNYKQYITKRNVAVAFLAIGLVGGVAFQHKIFSGVAWMTGTQDIELEDGRFASENEDTNKSIERVSSNESVNSSKFWIQDNYSDEIESLSDQEYYVTQQNGTERPFQNELYDEKRAGIYVDVVSGAPLFSSKHKFDSGTGWPSFYKPLEHENIIERKDPGPLGVRVEIAAKHSKSHLGHLFENPNTPTGLRYCLNSAALEFIPAEKLEEEGYGQYSSMFEES